VLVGVVLYNSSAIIQNYVVGCQYNERYQRQRRRCVLCTATHTRGIKCTSDAAWKRFAMHAWRASTIDVCRGDAGKYMRTGRPKTTEPDSAWAMGAAKSNQTDSNCRQ